MHDTDFRRLSELFSTDSRVSTPARKRGHFGSDAYAVDDKIFAMMVDGYLVVKLPKKEVDAAVEAGFGSRMKMGSRTLKEWLVVDAPPQAWTDFVTRARTFVGGDR